MLDELGSNRKAAPALVLGLALVLLLAALVALSRLHLAALLRSHEVAKLGLDLARAQLGNMNALLEFLNVKALLRLLRLAARSFGGTAGLGVGGLHGGSTARHCTHTPGIRL